MSPQPTPDPSRAAHLASSGPTLATHVEHLYLSTRPTFLTVNCIPTGVAMKPDERAPSTGPCTEPAFGVPAWRVRRSARLHAPHTGTLRGHSAGRLVMALRPTTQRMARQ